MEVLSMGKALSISLIGFSIVFIVLILLMAVIVVMSKIIKLMNRNEKKETITVINESAPTAAPAKGSCGDLTLVKVSERDAAMIMAIVADQLKTPINELRFISIKEAE